MRNGHQRQIDLANQEGEEQPLADVSQVDPPRKIPEWERRLLCRAAKENWPITGEQKKEVVKRVAGVLKKSTSAKAIVAAAKVLVAVDSANINREKTLLANELAIQKATGVIAPDGPNPGGSLNVQVNVNNNIVSNALEEPEYLEYLRTRALENDCNTGTIRT